MTTGIFNLVQDGEVIRVKNHPETRVEARPIGPLGS